MGERNENRMYAAAVFVGSKSKGVNVCEEKSAEGEQNSVCRKCCMKENQSLNTVTTLEVRREVCDIDNAVLLQFCFGE